MEKKIVVAGSILVDHINTIDAMPASGELVQIRSIRRAAGGLVPNTGRDLKLLDPSIEVLATGVVGDDDDGAFAIRELESGGLETAVRISKTEATSFTDVMSVPGGERTFFTFPGASAGWGYDDFPFESVNAGDIVLLGYFLLLAKIDAGDGLKILRRLKDLGAMTAIDLVSENSDRYALVRECLPYVDYLIINEVEAARIAGKDGVAAALAEDLLALGVRELVVIHEPAKGTALRRGGKPVEVESVDIPKSFIVDKTGAGDAFCAGALTGIFRGLDEREILRRGAVAAVGALSAAGATAGVRDFATLEKTVEKVRG